MEKKIQSKPFRKSQQGSFPFNHHFFSKKTEESLTPETELISDATDRKSKELQESIVYAKRIQEGMMLKEKHLFRLFPSSFILFQPKDLVSGDFYWFTKIANKIIVAVADCTGHGIPGAFMSVLGISLLNQIVIEEEQTDASLILQRLDHKVNKAFAYSPDYATDPSQYDGMDIALCVIDTEKLILHFAGALRPVYLILAGKFMKLQGSRYPIGGMQLEIKREYASTSFSLSKGDKLYLFSDGFPDQFGGKHQKKFLSAAFRDTLIKTSVCSMQTQGLELKRIFEEWKGLQEQTDDVLVVGLEF